MVIGHVLDGIQEIDGSDIFGLTYLHRFIYTFHMPIFFIASGVAFAAFSNQSIAWVEFLQSKLTRLLIPLICWTPVFFILKTFCINQVRLLLLILLKLS